MFSKLRSHLLACLVAFIAIVVAAPTGVSNNQGVAYGSAPAAYGQVVPQTPQKYTASQLKPGTHVEVTRLAYVHATPSVMAAAKAIRSEDQLAKASPAVRQVIQTPTTEKVTVRVAAAKASGPVARTPNGHGHLGHGCWNVWVYKERDNAFGWTLIFTETKFVSVCPIGRSGFSYDPYVDHQENAHWGWFFCSWKTKYEFNTTWNGYRGKGGGGTAQFMLGYKLCPAPLVQLWTEMQVFGSGDYWWWYN